MEHLKIKDVVNVVGWRDIYDEGRCYCVSRWEDVNGRGLTCWDESHLRARLLGDLVTSHFNAT